MINIHQFQLPNEVLQSIAKRESRIRKQKKLSQRQLANMSRVSLGSIRRFEQTGKISLESLVKIAFALSCEQDFEFLFKHKIYKTLKDVIDEREKNC